MRRSHLVVFLLVVASGCASTTVTTNGVIPSQPGSGDSNTLPSDTQDETDAATPEPSSTETDPAVNVAVFPLNPEPLAATGGASQSLQAAVSPSYSWGGLSVVQVVAPVCGSPFVFEAGDVGAVAGIGFMPGATVVLSFEVKDQASIPLGALTADVDGLISGEVTMPAGQDPSAMSGVLASGAGAEGEIRELVGLVALIDRSPPCFEDDTAATTLDTPVEIDVFANDVATPDVMDPTTLVVTDPPVLGTAVVDNVTGMIVYTPLPGVVGTETFTHIACTTAGLCGRVPITVTILAG